MSDTNISNNMAQNTPTILISNSHLSITKSTISSNRMIKTKNSSLIIVLSSISNCFLQDNNLFSFAQKSNVMIRETIFEENHFMKIGKSKAYSLVLCDQNSNVTIESCKFYNNSAVGFGTVFHCFNAYMKVASSTVWTIPYAGRISFDGGSMITTHGCSFHSIDTKYTDFNTKSLGIYSNSSHILLHNVSVNKHTDIISTDISKDISFYGYYGFLLAKTSSISLAFTELQLKGQDSNSGSSDRHLPSIITFLDKSDTTIQELLTFNSTFIFGTKQMISSDTNFNTEAKDTKMISTFDLQTYSMGNTYVYIEETPYASCRYNNLCID